MKNNTINDLKKIIDICEKYELHTINERNKKLIDDVNEHTLKIMFVGAFSSGKSALINNFLVILFVQFLLLHFSYTIIKMILVK